MRSHLLKGFFCCLVLILISACATLYQPAGLTGGYSEKQLDTDVIEVYFKGNAYTSKDTVQTYVLYRCAEVTLEHGYDYFVVLNDNTNAQNLSIQTPGTYTATSYSNFSATAYGTPYGATAFGNGLTNTYGTYVPGQVYNFQKYDSSTIIKMFKGQKSIGMLTAFDARSVIQYLGKNIQRKY